MSDQDAAARIAVLCAVSALNCVMATAVGLAVFGVAMCILLAILDHWSPWPPHTVNVARGVIRIPGDRDGDELAELVDLINEIEARNRTRFA